MKHSPLPALDTIDRTRGFTLIELMIVVVIIGILTAIVYPSYREQMMKGRRASAKAALSEVVGREEQFFLDNKTYTTNMESLNMTGAVSGGASADTESGFYSITIVAATAGCPINNCFVASAAPQGDQANDKCGTLTLSSSGVKGDGGGTDCW